MWCLYYSYNGAFIEFRAFSDDIGQSWEGKIFYAAFTKKDDAARLANLINSATF